MKILYKVEPVDPASIFIKDSDEGSNTSYLLFALCIIGEFIIILINLIFGGYWWLYGALITLAVYGLSRGLGYLEFESTYNERKKIAIQQAEYYSDKLNSILEKSNEIVNEILPCFENTAINNLKIAATDFNDNALYPFWERIEEICNNLGAYKEAVDQLILNGELYSKALASKRHNFPTPFPFGTSISISQNVFDDFYSIVRRAHTNSDFANIYGHYKSHKILIAGFQTLADAINNMNNSIISSIDNLEQSIKSDFRELKNFQIQQLETFKKSQYTLNNTLNSMDQKLYYIQYKKQPRTPFIRKFNG